MVKLLGALLLSLFLVGCNQYPDSQKTDLELRTEITELQIRANKADAEIASLRESLKVTSNWLASLEASRLNSAHLVPGDPAYRTVKTDIGSLLVSLSDIQPYANGSQVKIEFGNATSVTIVRPKAKFQWGVNTKDGLPDYLNGKSRVIAFDAKDAGLMRPGQWTTVVFQLDGVPPSELDFISVSEIDWSSVLL